jgi:hypothetical protein
MRPKAIHEPIMSDMPWSCSSVKCSLARANQASSSARWSTANFSAYSMATRSASE